MKTPKRKTKSANKVSEAEKGGGASAPVASTPVASAAAQSIAVRSTTASSMLVLASNCTVKDAAALKLDLCAIAHQSEVTIDVAALERIDTSTMQLLCAFVHDRAARKQQVLWKGNSVSWREAVRLLGAAELLGLKQADEGMLA